MAEHMTTELNDQHECFSSVSCGSVVVGIWKYFSTFVFDQMHKEMNVLFSINRTLELRTVCVAVDNESRHRYCRWLYPAYFSCYTSALVISRGSRIKASRLWTEDIKPAGILLYLLQLCIRSTARWISCSFWPLSDLHLLLHTLSFLTYQLIFRFRSVESYIRTRTHKHTLYFSSGKIIFDFYRITIWFWYFISLSKQIWREEMKVAFQILEHLLWREKSLNLYTS